MQRENERDAVETARRNTQLEEEEEAASVSGCSLLVEAGAACGVASDEMRRGVGTIGHAYCGGDETGVSLAT